ncbi:MAG: dihydroorotate dehydrogenase electron transfer subunit [Prevotella sp.]|nr:dihydroorotate dehydrogenase electron transfer subunit [Candidatus Prevotella equi]
MKHCIDLTVKSVEHINEKYVLVKLTDNNPLPEMKPGQFVEIKVEDSPKTFLRRPISINNVETDTNELHLLIAIVGDGTRHMAKLVPGDKLNVMLPLGNGFTLPEKPSDKHLLVGGGVGVAPLLYLGKKIKEMGGEPTFLLGARSAKDLLMIDKFKSVGRVFITTEDGSEGEKGFVTNHSILNKETFKLISTCGPKPMMVAVARYADNTNIECEVSLENKMACGLGACLCCVEKTQDKGNICICTEGPVINAKRLEW